MTDVFVHPTATLEDGASVGPGTKLWHHVHVMKGAVVGAGCSFGKDCFVASGAIVGARARVQNGVSLYEGVTLEDDVFVGPHAVFTNVLTPRAGAIGPRSATHIERNVTIGASAVILCGNRVGHHAFVGAGAVVTRDVKPHSLVVGNPARHVGWVSKAGQRLEGSGLVRCPVDGSAYLVTTDDCKPAPDSNTEPAPIRISDMKAEIAFFRPALEAAFQRTLEHGGFILGTEVAAFEREVSEKLGIPHVIGVSSGSDALLASLMALGVGPGDEVITSPFSFISSATCIVRLGARPIFVDIDPSTHNLDPRLIDGAITPKTRAIVPVHLFGRPIDDAVFDLANARRIPVLEDAAQAAFATTPRGPVGGLGHAGCFSFFPTKNLGALGDGGLVVTRDEAFANRVRAIRNHGAAAKYEHTLLGGNFRLDALQAAFLRAKLPHLDTLTRRRQENARVYDELLGPAEAAGQLLRPRPEGSVFHHYVIRSSRRDELRAALQAQGIETAIHYPAAIHQTAVFRQLMESWGGDVPSLPKAEHAAREVLALPVHPWLERRDIERVAAALLKH